MKKIKIISKTEKGVAALKQHIEEVLKMNRVKRAIIKQTGIVQECIGEAPYTLEVRAIPNSPASVIKPKHACDEFRDALKLNGAEEEIDYIFEVEQ